MFDSTFHTGLDLQRMHIGSRLRVALFVLGTMALGAGCATVRPDHDASRRPSPKSLNEILEQDLHRQSPTEASARLSNPDEIVVRGIKLKNTQFDIPITVNSRVEYWIDYFTGKGRPHFTRYLERSEFFIPYIQPILRENGMPEDLVYLAMIESGFNNLARSHARAVGPWQFISATGKRYGLTVNWWIDERRDIRKSTLAAAEYLKDLYMIFQSWELAAAAYNAGESKIARGVRRYGTKDFWVIARSRFLRPETRDYVPKIIAAAMIAKNRAQFGFEEAAVHPDTDEAVAPDGEVVKLIKSDRPTEDEAARAAKAEDLKKNPDEFDSIVDEDTEPSTAPATFTTPVEPPKNDGLLAVLPEMPLAKPVPTPHVDRRGVVGGAELVEFEIQSPADLLKIARAAGLSYQTVKSLNPELMRWCTPPRASSYNVKLPSFVKDRFLTTYNHQAFPRRVQFLTYKVRRGENLQNIARHFGIKVEPIADLNGVSPRVALRAGTKVMLPMPNDRSRSVASLDVRDPPERRRRGRHIRKAKYRKISYVNRKAARVGNRGQGT